MSALDSLAAAADTPRKLVLLHPKTRRPMVLNDTEEVAHIMVLGQDGIAAQKMRLEHTEAAIGRTGPLTAQELYDRTTNSLAALTTGWLLVAPDGTLIDYEFTPENARKLYGAPKFAWIRDAVDQFVSDRSNFFGDAS